VAVVLDSDHLRDLSMWQFLKIIQLMILPQSTQRQYKMALDKLLNNLRGDVQYICTSISA